MIMIKGANKINDLVYLLFVCLLCLVFKLSIEAMMMNLTIILH